MTVPTTRPHAFRRPLAVATALTAAATLGLTASATAATQVVVPRSAGLSAPTGTVQTPDGARWVADAALGICRLSGSGPRLVEDLYCSPETAPHVGPLKATGLVFDDRSSNFYSGDAQSNVGAIWRLHYDAVRGVIDRADRVADLGDDRATAIALQPATAAAPAALIYTTKRTALVRRLPDPAAGMGTPETVGTAGRPDIPGVAVLDDTVYLADGTGITRLGTTGRAGRTATVVPGTAGIAASALAADPARGRVYAGTSIPELTDDVIALEPATGKVETYVQDEFTGITGLGVDEDGAVLVADDPGVAVGAIDSLNQGRLFRIPFAPLGRSRTTIDAAPAGWSAASSVTFSFSSDPGAAFECRLDGAMWERCGASVTYENLAEGPHAFEVRARTDIGPGPAARRVFVLDRTAPVVTVSAPGATVPFGGGRIEVAAGEAPVTFSCGIDDAAPAPCEPGEPLPAGLTVGPHTLHVTARDAAGNTGLTVDRSFTVTAPPPAPPVATAAPAEPTVAPAPVAPVVAAPAATPARAATPVDDAPIAPARARVARLRIRPNRIATRNGVKTIKLSFESTPDARTAHVVILSAGCEQPVERRDVGLIPGRTVHRLRVRLAAGVRLQPGVYRVTVQVSDTAGVRGNRGDHRLWVKRRA